MDSKKKPWWSRKYGKDKICGISLVRLRPGKNKEGFPYIVTLPCEHSFYRKALIEWIKKCNEPTCPICRTSFEAAICFLK